MLSALLARLEGLSGPGCSVKPQVMAVAVDSKVLDLLKWALWVVILQGFDQRG